MVLAGLALACAAPAACAQVLTPPLQLLLFHPARPGVLSQCENAHGRDTFGRDARPDPADPQKAWVVETAFTLHWPDGAFTQAGALPDAAALPIDRCFALLSGGQPVLSGAVVDEWSARRLDFMALVRLCSEPGTPTRYVLQARFPLPR
ncbi:hypothetical protein C666_05640 [Thauera linaloolentis 47Lol = DSM 12138]|uniref:Uncharacterized protein n=2 Tax=Thauera linaloolentis TaxID=76112 RepID=N6YDA3_THAL4|nr:hypothetical protein C666_05640 [Thauera linaloolentis 47Lol = DSM 12138]